jgi:hypothetical protein
MARDLAKTFEQEEVKNQPNNQGSPNQDNSGAASASKKQTYDY